MAKHKFLIENAAAEKSKLKKQRWMLKEETSEKKKYTLKKKKIKKGKIKINLKIKS